MSTSPNTRQLTSRTAPTAADPTAPLAVWKFGGTSVADQTRLRAVAERMVAAHRDGRRVVAVLSAMGKSTDELVGMAYGLNSRPPPREMDALLAVGEQISCALAAMAVHELGEKAVSFTGGQAGMLTDDTYGNARLREVRPERIISALDEGNIVLVTGFQGVSPSGDTTTLGRGGSDASAVAVAAGLGATECEIFTDVAGVFTADPRVVPDARPLTSLRHEEMLEMAEAGAGVLQPRSVELAATHGIDIHLRSSFTGEDGTWIRKDSASSSAPNRAVENSDVAGVAHRDSEPLYAVRGVSPAAVATALAVRGAALGAVVRHGDELRFTAPGVEVAEVTAALASIETSAGTGADPADATGVEVTVHGDLGTVSVISMGIARRPDITARALTALQDAGIDARFVTTTSGRVSVHVATDSVHDAVRLLHGIFIPARQDATVTDLRPAAAAS